jgi:DivIVA domain-containing protein
MRMLTAVERDEIERRDFPTGRRGYDPAAVDEHLRRVADAFERREQPPASTPLAESTSEQVRAILEAAERSAAELQARAGEEAASRVAEVQAAAEGFMARLDELERELKRLLDALRAGGRRITEGLQELQAQARAIGGDAEPGSAPETPASEPPTPEPEATPSPAPEPATRAQPAVDEAGARLAALNLALSGSSREETARYLTEQFGIEDPSAMLDDVYSRAGR